MDTSRRNFFKKAGIASAVAGAMAVVPAELLAQTKAEAAKDGAKFKYRVNSAFPQTLDTIFYGLEVFAAVAQQLTNGNVTFDLLEYSQHSSTPTAITELLDRVKKNDFQKSGSNVIEGLIAHTCAYYYIGVKDGLYSPLTALCGSLPFGPCAKTIAAKYYEGADSARDNGKGLGQMQIDGFLANHNMVHHMVGNTGTQMGGWFSPGAEPTLANFKAGKIRFRTAGLGKAIFEKLGAVVQLAPGGQIIPLLKQNFTGQSTINAAEWVGPYDDNRLGFSEVMPAGSTYAKGSFVEPNVMISLFINKETFDKMPDAYKNAFNFAAQIAHNAVVNRYDVRNMNAMLTLAAQNKYRIEDFEEEVIEAAFDIWNKDILPKYLANPEFKAAFESLERFRKSHEFWLSISENKITSRNLLRNKLESQGKEGRPTKLKLRQEAAAKKAGAAAGTVKK